MSNILKKILVLLIIIIFIAGFSASYKSLNISNSAFAVAIGIDKSESKKLKVTFEFISTSPSGESVSETEPVLTSVECSSITSGINMMNAYLGKKVNLSHCKLIIFSEELAKEGISDEIYSLINEVQIRPSANIVISKCATKDYIENSKPSIENLIPRYYDTFPNTSEYTGYTCNATIGDFFNALVCNSCSPYAILGSVNSSNEETSENSSNQSSSNESSENSSDKKSGNSSNESAENSSENSANELSQSQTTENSLSQNQTTEDSEINSDSFPVTGDRASQNIGVAVFKEDKLVGELNAIETICFLNMRKEVDSFLVSIPDPQNSDSKIDIYLTPNSTHDIDVNIVNGTPNVKIKLEFSGKIYSISKDSEYLNEDTLNSISASCNNYLEEQFFSYLYKTSSDFESDINRIGLYALSEFSTTTDFDNYKWLDNYKNTTFDIEINTVIDSGFLLTQT